MSKQQRIPDRPVAWGVIGTGMIAGHFAADLAYSERSVLAAVCSRSAEKASAFASRHGGAASYSSLSSLLADEHVDAVYVASPNDTHYATVRAALEAGKAVLVEKPLVLTSVQAERLAALATERGQFLMEGMWTRFLPAFSFVKTAVASGAIGQVRRIECDLAFHHPFTAKSRFYDKAQGGGALLDLGIYPISLTLALMGRPDAIRGNWKAAPSGVDSSASAQLMIGDVETWLTCAIDRAGTNLFIIEGTRGTLVLQPPFIGAQTVLHLSDGPFRRLGLAKGTSFAARAARYLARNVPLPGVTRHRFDFPGYGLQFEIDAASNAIADGLTEHPVATLSDSIETLRVIETVLSGPPGDNAF